MEQLVENYGNNHLAKSSIDQRAREGWTVQSMAIATGWRFGVLVVFRREADSDIAIHFPVKESVRIRLSTRPHPLR